MKRLLSGLWLVGLSTLGLTSQSAYYREHPSRIQAALLACPYSKPKGITCQELSHVAQDTQALLFELEQTPQQYGLNIMRIQANIASYQLMMQHVMSTSQQQRLLHTLDSEQQRLNARLALIRLLETPGVIG